MNRKLLSKKANSLRLRAMRLRLEAQKSDMSLGSGMSDGAWKREQAGFLDNEAQKLEDRELEEFSNGL